MAIDQSLLVDLTGEEGKSVKRLFEKAVTIPPQPRVLQELQDALDALPPQAILDAGDFVPDLKAIEAESADGYYALGMGPGLAVPHAGDFIEVALRPERFL